MFLKFFETSHKKFLSLPSVWALEHNILIKVQSDRLLPHILHAPFFD